MKDDNKITEKDIFDRFVDKATKLFFLKWFRYTYDRHKMFWLYALFGLGTILFSVNTYQLFTEEWGWEILIANAVSWVFATMFAFLTNRQWVFTERKFGVTAFFTQLSGFYIGRFFTLVLEEIMLWAGVTALKLPNMPVKYAAQVMTIIVNYFISKLLVFRNKGLKKQDA